MSEAFKYFLNRPNFELIRYSFENATNYHFGIHDTKTGFRGFGGADNLKLAQTKSLFELIERTVFHLEGQNLNSSGWAAHSNLDEARASASLELIERDAVLCSWILKIAPKKLENVFFKTFKKSFPILQFGKGTSFFVLGVILENPVAKTRMLITATCKSFSEGYQKLIIDSERAASLLRSSNLSEKNIMNAHHLNFCSSSTQAISWLYLDGKGIEYNDTKFSFIEYVVPLWNNTTAFVVKATNQQLQPLFYGNDNFKNINRKRMRSLSGPWLKFNRSLHPII